MASPPEIALAPLEPVDWNRVRTWLRQPEIQSWWGGLASAEAEIAIAADSASAVVRMLVAGGVPIGYGQALDADLVRSARTEGLPSGSYLVTLFIADPAHRRRGAGQAALAALTREVFSTTLAVACATIVPLRFEAAARAAERAGYCWMRVSDDAAAGQGWLMVKERP